MGLISRLRDVLGGPSREEMERLYLEQSVSRIDLELREREISRGRFANFPRRR